jgi:putative membrane protein
METVFLVVAVVFAILAALLHVVIFFMESVLWTRPAIWRRFGLRSQDDAVTIQPMAYNQGFYNLFLAIATALGLLMLASPPVHIVGIGVAGVALASMLLASIVLITSNPRLARAAATQGLAPLVALVFGVLWVALD